LAEQQDLAAPCEVLVVDDGSAGPENRRVVFAMRERMPVTYYYQEDRGFRAAAARNVGAAHASGELLVFIDTGVLPTRRLIRAHADAYRRDTGGVIGYVYGYDTSVAAPDLSADAARDPDATVARFRATSTCVDMREAVFRELSDRLEGRPAPWALFWTTNASVPADVFWRAGGFDERFVGWGAEDIELGYRIQRLGLEIRLARCAAAIHLPHTRAIADNEASHRRNMLRFHRLHPEPIVELMTVSTPARINREFGAMAVALDRRRMAAANGDPPSDRELEGENIVLFGCERLSFVSSPGVVAGIEPDNWLLTRARMSNPAADLRCCLGVRTGHADGSFDRSVVSGSLKFYPPAVLRALTDEAARIAHRVEWTAPRETLCHCSYRR
jgi:GT2 family glycosyltransferase